jgi:hypothetical protein
LLNFGLRSFLDYFSYNFHLDVLFCNVLRQVTLLLHDDRRKFYDVLTKLINPLAKFSECNFLVSNNPVFVKYSLPLNTYSW